MAWSATRSYGGSSLASAPGAGGNGSEDTPAISTTQSSRKYFHDDWSASSGSGGEGLSARLFHSFRGKKTHKMLPARDCFVPPRHLSEPTSRHGLVSVEGLTSYSSARDTSGSSEDWPAAPAGITKSAHLPPMIEATIDGRPVALAASNPLRGRKHLSLSKPPLTLKSGASEQPPIPSFQRKFAARRKVWVREAEAEAEQRALQKQWRTEELLRKGGVDCGRGGGYKAGGRGGARLPSSIGDDACLGSEDPRSTRRRRRRGRHAHGSFYEDTVAELSTELEKELLAEMFKMLDAHNRGAVRLNEVVFHMTENKQVRRSGVVRGGVYV